MFTVATMGTAPGAQSFDAIDARAPICLKPQISLKYDGPLICQFEDQIRVTHYQRPLMRRAQPGHLHRDALPAARVESRPRTAWHAFQIEVCAEVGGLECIARDVEGM